MSFVNCSLCSVVASGSAARIADHTASAAASAPRAAAVFIHVFIFAAMAAPQNSGHNIEHDHVQELREPKCKRDGFEYALFFRFWCKCTVGAQCICRTPFLSADQSFGRKSWS